MKSSQTLQPFKAYRIAPFKPTQFAPFHKGTTLAKHKANASEIGIVYFFQVLITPATRNEFNAKKVSLLPRNKLLRMK